jgi:uncharacterized membrane protein YqjE
MPPAPGGPRPPGLFESISRLGRTTLHIARTRFEILATELEEERIRFVQLVLLVGGIACCLQVAVVLLVMFLVVALWDTHRLVTLGVFVVLFLAAGIGGIMWLRQRLRSRPRMFAATLGELAKDEDRLGGAG